MANAEKSAGQRAYEAFMPLSNERPWTWDDLHLSGKALWHRVAIAAQPQAASELRQASGGGEWRWTRDDVRRAIINNVQVAVVKELALSPASVERAVDAVIALSVSPASTGGENEEAADRIATLEAALRPFADCAERLKGDDEFVFFGWEDHKVILADFRLASKAMGGGK